MNNIIPFSGAYYLDLPPDDILEGAKASGFKQVIVVGLDENDEVSVLHSSTEIPEVNWMLDIAKMEILTSED